MNGAQRTALIGVVLSLCVKGVSADSESTGIIIASVVAGVILLSLILGVAIFCLHKHRSLDDNRNVKHPRKKKHKTFVVNGYHAPPQPVQRYEKRRAYDTNGYGPPVTMVPQPAPVAAPLPPQPRQPPPAAYIKTAHMQPGPMSYATYHGPPPQMRRERGNTAKAGTMSGPPPTIFIPYDGTGTMTIRADPRPVVHKSAKRKTSSEREDSHRSPSRHRSSSRPRSQPPAQEFVVQQSYDGVPVIRPVIYVDDDSDRRRRSKSRENRYRKKSPSPSRPKITEITEEKTAAHTNEKTADIVIKYKPVSRQPTPPPAPSSSAQLRASSPEHTQKERSRASSVTEAVNALRMSVQDHLDDSVSTTSHDSSNAPSFAWTKSHRIDDKRAPEPAAGDVMFFPAGTLHDTNTKEAKPEPKQNPIPQPRQNDEVIYSYTKVISSSIKKERAPTPEEDNKVPVPGPRPHVNEGYEVPSSLRGSKRGTREETKLYETEHDIAIGDYGKIGTSMSDRLQNLVEDGDKTRFSHYNIGAVDFGDETDGHEEAMQLRTRRPDTPPVDIPKESHYAQVIRRPRTPPNDIPLVSPRDDREIPPLNLRSTINSPREASYRPSTPPKDFPITPQSSFIRPRPATPPTDFPMTPTADTDRQITLSHDAQETSRSAAVDPKTGEVGSFEARKRLIEAHLKKNISSSGPSHQAPKPSAPKPTPAPAPPPPVVPTVTVTPGVIPPAPPPPPLPPAFKA